MLRPSTILILFCYSILLSGSIFSIGHSILHATSSLTGIHTHKKQEVNHQQAHRHGHSHKHTHHVHEHSSLFKNLPSFTEEGKEILYEMAFLMFYYHPTYHIQQLSFELSDTNESLYSDSNSIYKNSPLTPPPDQLLASCKQL